ncbi:hypothetical protein [Methyloglobulus sp.]|uniref:hypothetical protein n=1 Tax=Methyloglobulus sp. TaxID=2518622 RepID=UPI0032B87330
MKKYFIALLFGMSLMSMQTASAATLALSLNFGDGVITSNTGSTFSGTTTKGAVWDIGLSGLGASGLGDLVLTITPLGQSLKTYFDVMPPLGLIAGSYSLTIIGASTFTLTAKDAVGTGGNNVPVPAAVWLFGSALMGLLGVTRRKSRPALAA